MEGLQLNWGVRRHLDDEQQRRAWGGDATGPAPVYYESGYLPTADFWRLGTIYGLLFLASLLLVGVPLMTLRGG